MENAVENSQIEEFIANLKGRNLQMFVKHLRSKYGAKVKLK